MSILYVTKAAHLDRGIRQLANDPEDDARVAHPGVDRRRIYIIEMPSTAPVRWLGGIKMDPGATRAA